MLVRAGTIAIVAVALACTAHDRAAATKGEEAPAPNEVDRPAAHAEDPGPVDNGQPSGVYPAPHLPAPRVTSLEGPILAHPRVVPVVFARDGYALEIPAFLRALAASTYWASTTSEYGVGALAVSEPVVVVETPQDKLDDEAIQTWLEGAIDAATEGFLPPDGETLYALYFPAYVAISGARWGKSCLDFAGYHWETKLASGARVPYVVIPRCPSWKELHGFDVVSATSSHELVEAVTDPFPSSSPAFATVDQDHSVWRLFPLSELGDMCAVNVGADFRPRDLDYLVQRTWSNAAARAQHDPCGPRAEGDVYFNSVPVLRDAVTIDLVSGVLRTKGVKIPVGASETIEIALFSDGPTHAPWTVAAKDIGALSGRLPQLSFTFDRTEGTNGEKLHLTITALRQGQSGGAEFMLVSTLGERTSTWFGFVAN